MIQSGSLSHFILPQYFSFIPANVLGCDMPPVILSLFVLFAPSHDALICSNSQT